MRLTLFVTAFLLSSALFAQRTLTLAVGTYTSGRSEGIYLYRFDPRDGSARLKSVTSASNPSYLAVSPGSKFLYAVHEDTDQANNGGGISAYRLNARKGKLRFLNRQPSGGNHPCYVTVDASGRWVIAGNYSSGSVGILPVREDGSLDSARQIIRHSGKSIHPDRQTAPHVHQTVLTADERLLVPDLGIDKMVVYRFDPEKGTATEDKQATVNVSAGAGPRHVAVHPNGQWYYLTEELSGTVAAFRNGTDGKLKLLQRISAVPEGYTGTLSGADIHVSPDGRFVYSSNRGELNNLCIFGVDSSSGILSVKGYQSALGRKPRNFTISPDGRYLLVANQDSDQVIVFSRDLQSGLLTDTGKRIDVPNPVCLQWAD